MSRLASVGLLSGLLCACAATAIGAETQVPNFSSIDFPWFPGTGFLPPSSGPGPVTQDKTNLIIRRTANNVGDVEEGPLSMGQDAGLIYDIPSAGDIVTRIAQQAEEILTRKMPRLIVR